MALARLASKNLHQKVLFSPASFSAASVLGHGASERAPGECRRRFGNEFVQRFTAAANDRASGETQKSSDDKDVAVSEGKRFRLFPRRQGKRRGLWRNNDRSFVPALYGLGNALVQATENVNRVLENLNISPWTLSARVKEQADSYKLKFDVPGLAKEDLKITVHGGVLEIKGEHKEEKEGEGSEEEEYWAYYDTILNLPADAKVDDIKAELKDGVLTITIPRTEKPKEEVKEVIVD